MTVMKSGTVVSLPTLVLALVPGCADRGITRTQSVSPALHARSLAVLRTALTDLDSPDHRWARVHAAEMLIALGEPAGVEEVYLAELKQFADVPQYRIGIWRVLSRAARQAGRPDPWFDKIVAALVDPNGPDRQHAVETLGKLARRVPPAAEQAARQLMKSDEPAMAAFAAWVVGINDPNTGLAALKVMLESDVSEARRLAAYALRFQEDLAPDLTATLVRVALREPPNSTARLHLLSSALVHAQAGPEKTRLKSALLKYLETGTEPQRHEAANALAQAGDRGDIAALEPLLDSPEPDSRIGAAYAILRLAR